MQNRELYEKQFYSLQKIAANENHSSGNVPNVSMFTDLHLLIHLNNLLTYFNCLPFTADEMTALLKT